MVKHFIFDFGFRSHSFYYYLVLKRGHKNTMIHWCNDITLEVLLKWHFLKEKNENYKNKYDVNITFTYTLSLDNIYIIILYLII